MRQLTSLDAQFLAVEDGRNHAHVCSLVVLDTDEAPGGRVTLETLRALIAQRLDLLEPFRWKLAEVPLGLDHPYWVTDPDFELAYHTRELALPPGAGMRELATQAARIHARPLDRARPLWELYLIHGLPDGRVAMLTKVHHAAVDGISGAELVGAILDPSPEGRPVRVAPPLEPRNRSPVGAELLARALVNVPRAALQGVRSAMTTLPHLDQVLAVRAVPGAGTVARATARVTRERHLDGGVVERPPDRAPWTSLNARIGASRSFACASLSLTDVKQLKRAYGTTVNDVVVALCAGAIRTRLLARGELPDQPLLAMVPVSVRTPEQAGTFGNRITTMIVEIPTDEPDPEQRLRRAHLALRSAKERHRAIPATLLQDANHFVPAALMYRASRVIGALSIHNPLAPPVNVVISNVPGSPDPLYCAGARVEANYPMSAVLDGVGLNLTLLSYRDRIDVGVVGDSVLLPDAWELVDDLKAEARTLLHLLPTPR